MERHGKQLHVRMSASELAQARELADAADMTVSDLVRALLQLTPDDLGPGTLPLVVIDRVTAARLDTEMRRWGNHYNQAVHALNAIAYHMRLGQADASDALEELPKVRRKLDAVEGGVAKLHAEAARIASLPMARL